MSNNTKAYEGMGSILPSSAVQSKRPANPSVN